MSRDELKFLSLMLDLIEMTTVTMPLDSSYLEFKAKMGKARDKILKWQELEEKKLANFKKKLHRKRREP